MIRSMTGFGEASRDLDGERYSVEVRSLNNKFFKCSIRMSEEFSPLEPILESKLRQSLARGSVVCTVNVTAKDEEAALEINHKALTKYIDQLTNSPHFSGGDLTLQLGPLMSLPGVLQRPGDDSERLNQVRSIVSELLEEATQHLISMRKREGAVLYEDLVTHRDRIAVQLDNIKSLAPTVVESYQERLRERIDGLLEDVGRTIDPADLIKEVAIFAERSDIAEEITRLSAHLDQFIDLIGTTDGRPVGRTLDFLTQEMLREANTIASKSSDAGISRSIVEVKGAIDRIKEQVQNVE